MIRRLPTWLRVFALLLALTLSAETTGATAALVATAMCSHCCEHARASDDCPAQTCNLMCGVTCCVLMQDSDVAIHFSGIGGRWANADQSGSVRPTKPPVPPPRV